MRGLKRVRIGSVVARLWFVWGVVTLGDLITLQRSGYSDDPNYIPNAVFNLFTPVLVANVNLITIALLPVALWLGNRFGKLIDNIAIRVTYNLLVLFLMTVGIDLLLWGKPLSLHQATEAYGCVTTKPRPGWCPVLPTSRKSSRSGGCENSIQQRQMSR